VLDPHTEEVLPVRFSLPNGYAHGVDILKEFATVDTTDFDWLLLPALDQPDEASRSARSARSLTEQLMAAVALEPPGSRNAALAASATSALWGARNLEVHVAR
jgi:hypothetical protein